MTKIAFLGDIFAAAGRQAVREGLPRLRDEHAPDLVIANAENAARGSGLSPSLYHKLREMGIDAITLGDHVYRVAAIGDVLQNPAEPISRPANISAAAIGRQFIRVPLPDREDRSVFVITVLGRIFMSTPADDPFAAVDRILQTLPETNPIVIVEAHMEATSEKMALGRYLDGRVAAVLGTHTHVPTADAQVLPGGTGFITDVGMCGPYNSVIGRDTASVLRYMTTGMYSPFGIGTEGAAMCGALLDIGEETARCRSIQRIEYRLDDAAESSTR